MSHLVVYKGHPHTGDPVFNRRCPECSRFTKSGRCEFVWRDERESARAYGHCKKHGQVELALVTWE